MIARISPLWLGLSCLLLWESYCPGSGQAQSTSLPPSQDPSRSLQRQGQPIPPAPPEPESLPDLDKLNLSPPPSTPQNPAPTVPSPNADIKMIRGFRLVADHCVLSNQEIKAAIGTAIGPRRPLDSLQFQCVGPNPKAVAPPVRADLSGQPLTDAELLQAADAVSQLYLTQKYLTSGVVKEGIAVQPDGIVIFPISEGQIVPRDIQVKFEKAPRQRRKLSEDYIRSRIALATQPPLNYQRLLETLQLLQLNTPLIEKITAELRPSTEAGKSILAVTVTESKTLSASALLDNGRSPSVGTFQRRIQVTEADLFGKGDSASVVFGNTNGSNTFLLGYTYPLNPRDGTLSLNIGLAGSRIIEKPFDVLDIKANSQSYDLTYRQPLTRTPTREFALGVTLSRRDSAATLLDGLAPYPSIGAEADGKTHVTALRFFQDAIWRSPQEVMALRSQFNLGLGFLGGTVNDFAPDSKFVSWLGQAQWSRVLYPGSVLVLRADAQLANRALLPSEQFGLGGVASVRGFRQDALLTDNGLFASAEWRIPIVRTYQSKFLFQIAPFVDIGTGWNRESDLPDPTPRTLASAGLGLRLQAGDNFSARLDWGIPLTARPDTIPGKNNTWQEDGIYLSVVYTFY